MLGRSETCSPASLITPYKFDVSSAAGAISHNRTGTSTKLTKLRYRVGTVPMTIRARDRCSRIQSLDFDGRLREVSRNDLPHRYAIQEQKWQNGGTLKTATTSRGNP
jgi:hypothetical protein